MSLVTEIKAMTRIQKNQQAMEFYMVFVKALFLLFSAVSYVKHFGAEGLVMKDYAVAIIGLFIIFPFVGRAVKSFPMTVFRYSVVMEIVALLGFYLVSIEIYPEPILLSSSFILVFSNTIMLPLRTQVESIVIGGCPDYSVTTSKLLNIYVGLSAIVGAFTLWLGISTDYIVIALIISILASRYYRNKVFTEVFVLGRA